MKTGRILCCVTAAILFLLGACGQPAFYSADAGIFKYDVALDKHSYARGETLTAEVTMNCGVECNGMLASPDSITSHVIRAYIECNGEKIADCKYADGPCDGKESAFRIHPGDKLETTVSWKVSDDYELYADDKLMLVLDVNRNIGEIPITLSGYPKREPINLTNDDIFTEFRLHFDGCWNIYQHYDIVPCDKGWRLTFAVSEGEGPDDQQVLADCIATDETVKKVSAILAKYNAGSWNFYDETAEGVMDGGGFTLNVTYPGFSIRAKGWNEFPDGLIDLGNEIKAVFEEFNGRIDF